MHKIWRRLASIITLGLIIQISAHAQQYVQIYNGNTTTSLNPYFEIMWEPSGPLSIEAVLSNNFDFFAVDRNNPNFGLSDKGLWLRVNIDNLSNSDKLAATTNFSQLDYVDFYLLSGNTVLSKSMQGKVQGNQNFREPTFVFDAPTGTPLTLYVRVQSTSSSLIVPVVVQSQTSMIRHIQFDSIVWGLFYGGLIILAIYNLALFVKVKQVSLLAYIGYIGSVILWQFIWGGHIYLLFPHGQPLWLARHTEIIFVFMGVGAGLFTMTFLETKRHAHRIHYFLPGLIVLQVIIGILSATDVLKPSTKNVLLFGIICLATLSYVAAGFEAFYRRFKPAIYFIFAWTILALGALLGLLALVDVVPANIYTYYCFQAAVFLEAGLFSFALMEKTQNQLQDEIEQATNDLRNNMEVIEEQNARLDIARKDAVKASNIKSQFLANMSHEIRTPLNAILGFGKELEQANLEFTENEQVKIVNSAAENLLTIVNDVLDFSKIEAGKLQVNNSPFSPLEVFEEMVAIMAKTAHSKGLDFIFDSSPLPEKLISDDIRLKQVLTNLIGNALKFTTKGSVSLSVSAKHRKHGVIDLLFEVSDTGIGISRADRKKLFSAFSQVDDAVNRNYQGTGLGLVISQELVRLMNGTIDLRSQPGSGSTFSVMVRASHINQRSSFSYPNKVTNISVVIFDPMPDSRRATAKMLVALGAKVTSVDSLEFLQMIDQDPDFLMIFLPNQSRFSEATVMHCALTLNAKNRIVWYCNQDPLQSRPIFRQGFSTSLSMPATPSRLAQLVAIDSMPVLKRPQKTANSSSSSKRESNLPRLAILAVDDMAMNLSLLETWFTDTSVTLTKALSAEEAIRVCRNTEFDIILMDVQMPVMDGLEASKEIRKIELNLGTPIIAVTAHAFKEEQDRLLANGMDDYLPKPIAYDALIKTLQRWCDITDNTEQASPKITHSEHNQAVSWRLAMTRSHEDEKIAKRMMKEFVAYVPNAQTAISNAAKSENFIVLSQEIHKLHGASCYTGAPIIQTLSEKIEIHLKRKQLEQALTLLPNLYTAISQFEKQSAVFLVE